MRKSLLAIAAGVMAVSSVQIVADPPRHSQSRSHRAHDAQRYDRQGRYITPRPLRSNDRVWRGKNGQYHCKRDNGTTGLIIGGAAGALLGRALDGGESRTLGTILGAAGGALIGKEIDSSGLRCR